MGSRRLKPAATKTHATAVSKGALQNWDGSPEPSYLVALFEQRSDSLTFSVSLRRYGRRAFVTPLFF
jgi:hypothetical protein